MFSHQSEKYVDRQVRQISFLSQYIHVIKNVHGTDNVVPDALSCLEVAALQDGYSNPHQWLEAQAADAELRMISPILTKYAFRPQARDTPDGSIYIDFSTGTSVTATHSTASPTRDKK